MPKTKRKKQGSAVRWMVLALLLLALAAATASLIIHFAGGGGGYVPVEDISADVTSIVF